MAELKSEQINVSDILPYDFVRENEVIASFSENGYELISPHFLKPSLYHEIQRYLKTSFSFTVCEPSVFNELLTNSFSINSTSSDISEELTDEFDLQSFAGSITATEDLLSGSNDTPIIKLINGIISQAVKSRASDIHFEPYEDNLVVRFRIDAVSYTHLRAHET